MKKSIVIVLFFICISFIVVNYFYEPNLTLSGELHLLDDRDAEQTLVNDLERLDKWFLKNSKRNLATDSYIFSNPMTIYLYSKPYHHIKYTKKIVKNDKISLGVKKLLIKFSQCLNLNDYLSLGRVVIDTNKIDLMYVFISPGPEYGFILDRNYSASSVKEFLKLVVEKFPQTEMTVNEIITGRNLRRIITLKEFGESYPVIECEN